MMYLNLLAVAFAMSCCISDLLYGKIFNFFWIGGSACGFLLNMILTGRQEIWSSLGGFLFPLAGGFLLFYFRMIGAGDIKELSALGSMLGVCGEMRLCIISIVLGGCISAGLLLMEGNAQERFSYFRRWVKKESSINGRVPYRPESERRKRSDGKEKKLSAGQFHFAVPVFMGMLLLAGSRSF